MKSSNIADSVFLVNLKYVKLQNQTKELFFKCLQEHKDLDYFKDQMKKIWGNLDHSYMDQEIDNYTEIIHTKNIHDKEVVRIKQADDVFELVPESVVIGQENKFVKVKEREYKNALNSAMYKKDEENYLKKKVEKYTSQTVPYYFKAGGKPRYVELSTYASMIHNTNLTRAGWNQTLYDAELMDQKKFFIPYHPFSCPHCIEHQNRVFTAKEIMKIAHRVDEQQGDILHPNCKCELTFYENRSQFNKPKYSKGELQEQYDIRQKTNSLTLQKEKIKTDMKIQKSLGNQDEVDKLNQQRNKINKEIRDLKEELPTTSLKKQLTAINR